MFLMLFNIDMYKIFYFDNMTEENKKEQNLNWP